MWQESLDLFPFHLSSAFLLHWVMNEGINQFSLQSFLLCQGACPAGPGLWVVAGGLCVPGVLLTVGHHPQAVFPKHWKSFRR